MDVGLIALGLIILFGASILFKAAGFSGGEPTRLERVPAEPTKKEVRPPEPVRRETEPPAKPHIEPVKREIKPLPKPHIEPVRPEAKIPRRPTEVPTKIETVPVGAKEGMWACKSCLTENPPDAEFCKACGMSALEKKTSKVGEKQKRWFDRCGWSGNPFTLEILPSLFIGYHKQVETIMEKLNLQSGHILIMGDIGVGKTTFLRWLELNLPEGFHPLYIFRPPDEFKDIVHLMAYSINPDNNPEKYTLYNIGKAIGDLNKKFVLLLDEAHEFDVKIKKPLKTLGDIENIILVMSGLPEVHDRLKGESKPLYDRFIAKVVLDHLDKQETKNLMVKRIENVNGWGHEPFTEDSIPLIHKLSDGNPRNIIKICDRAMTEAIRQGVFSIDVSIINKLVWGEEAVKEEKKDRKAVEKEIDG